MVYSVVWPHLALNDHGLQLLEGPSAIGVRQTKHRDPSCRLGIRRFGSVFYFPKIYALAFSLLIPFHFQTHTKTTSTIVPARRTHVVCLASMFNNVVV